MLLCTGCSNLGYYAQSIGGQLDILASREPIEDLLEDENTDAALREKLRLTLQIRDFASKQLKLPDNDSYRSYVDTGKPYVVWNIFAAPEFSLELKTWCFLFAGCVSYRGYFDEADARDYAKDITEEQALDIYLRGVAAYSTLGWFDDPLLNTVIERDEAHLAGLIFHELAHQVLYIDNDSAFNESFAKTVELEGIRLYMQQFGSPEKSHEYTANANRRNGFVRLVSDTSNKLDNLYNSGLTDNDMRLKKSDIIDSMKADYEKLKQDWDGYTGYDKWFAEEINNAKIAAVTTYADYVPAFTALLRKNNDDFTQFYKACKKLGELPRDKRNAELARLTSK